MRVEVCNMINYPSLGDLMEKATTQEACLAEEYMLIKVK